MAQTRVFLVWGAALVVLFLVLPRGIPRDVVYLVVGLSAVTAIVIGIRRHSPAPAAPWWLFALGELSWVAGDTIYSWYEDVLHVSPFPSLADVGYLLAYPLLISGLVLLVRRAERGLDVRGLIDSTIVVLALGLLSGVWIAGPLFDADVPALERAIAIASPAGDILLLAGLVRLVSAGQRSSIALRLLAGAVTLQVVADTALAAGIGSEGSYAEWLDVLWLGQFVLWGACALHPQMAQVGAPSSGRVDQFTTRRVVVLGAAALLPSATAFVTLATGNQVDPWVLTGGSMILILLVVARMALGIVEIRFTTFQRDELEELLFHRAAHDLLTGTFNRVALLRAVEEATGRARTNGTETGLLVVELDDFKRVDADLGPVAADELLVSTAQRISEAVGDEHAIGRLGGAQFGVLVEHPEARQEATRIAHALAATLEPPHAVASRPVQVRARVGVALSADGQARAADLVDQASRASQSMLQRSERFGVFDDELRRELADQIEVEAGLRRAIADGDLLLHYQPVVDVGSLDVTGYEALIRWDRGGTLTMPDTFISIAEKSDVIDEVGRWALHEATRQLAAWLADDPDTFASRTVAVNISGRHLAGPGIVDDVTAALSAADLPARHLVIELTETVLVDDSVIDHLQALRELGVAISLDDFGTGYTSIRQLRRLPVDTLKIDKSLVAGTEPGSAELIALTTAAAHACGLRVVAEGVEHEAQLAMLRRLNCDAVQGFLLARPMPQEAVVGR